MTRKQYPPHLDGHPVSYVTYNNHRCRCQGCTAAKTEQHRAYRKVASPAVKKRMNRRKTVRNQRQNIEMGNVVNNRKPWTEEDRRVALDRTITVRQAAELLGRSIFAVKQYRSDHRDK